MYNPFSMKRILNPVGSGVITFGGGSSEGAANSGGGSRADKKGAAAVMSAPKPVYTHLQ